MPPNPNRHAIAQLRGLVSPSDVEGDVVQAKPAFLPLTHADQSNQQQPPKEEEFVSNPNADASYWDWPEQEEQDNAAVDMEAMIASILRQEEIRQTLSVAHIEENLVSSAAKQEEEAVQATTTDSDDYWNMPSENDSANTDKLVVAQHVEDAAHPKNSYWDWPTTTASQEKKRIIRNILEQERARQLTSTEAIEKNLKQAANDDSSHELEQHDAYWKWETTEEVVEASHVKDETHPRTRYWDWHAKKKNILEDIVRHEEIRQMLSTRSIQEKEELFAKREQPAPMVVVAAGGEANTSYWDW